MIEASDITIVIPVYNVSRYIDRCIESVLNQSVQGFLTILVDDGSTDDSGSKCDNYSKNNASIIALHKENGGLSDARNYGMSFVKSDFVTFIDSDDYVGENYIKILLDAINASHATMVSMGHVQEREGDDRKNIITSNEVTLYSREEALSALCHENKISTCAWGKLLPTSIVNKYPFPVGKTYEDLFTIYKYIGESLDVAYVDAHEYHYIQRKNSIRKQQWSEKAYDVISAAESLNKFIEENYPKLKDDAIYRYFYSANELYMRSYSSKEFIWLTSGVRTVLKKNYYKIINDKQASFLKKAQFFLMTYFPRIYRFVWMKYKM